MRRLLLVTMFLSLVTLPKTADAALIEGQLDFSAGVQVTSTSANWYLVVLPCCSGPNEATVNGSSLTNGGVAVYPVLPALIYESNLNFTTAIPGPDPLYINFFEYPCAVAAPGATCLPTTTIDFVLTHVATCEEQGGDATECFGNSPFLFREVTVDPPGPETEATYTNITLSLAGIVFDTTTSGLISTWTGNWTAQFPGTIAQAFAIIEPGGFINNSYSATKVTVGPQITAIPEPATLLMFGTGVAMVGRRLRRGKKA
jgi:hypothetical protein